MSNSKGLLRQEVVKFHREQSLLGGIPKADLKARVMPGGAAELFEHLLATTPELVQEGELVRLRTHRVVLKMDEQQARAAIESAFETAGLAAPAVGDVLKASGVEQARAHHILQIAAEGTPVTNFGRTGAACGGA